MIIIIAMSGRKIALAFYCECAHNYIAMKTQDVIDFFGSRKKAAEKLGIENVSAFSHWGDSVPELRQYQIQVLTKNKLKADPGITRTKAA